MIVDKLRFKGGHEMKRALLLLPVCAALAALAPARADEYWIRYDGTVYPEEAGWTRHFGAGGAERSLEDGALVLDGRDDIMIYDSDTMLRPIDPDPGELFIMRARLKVEEMASQPWDPGFGVTSDESWRAAFVLSERRIFNIDDLGMSASFEPGVFHTFELSSSNMRSFELRIDGNVGLTGPFTHIISASKIAWGDMVEGEASLSRWDYVEFGVVPEPASSAGFGLAVLILWHITRQNCTRS